MHLSLPVTMSHVLYDAVVNGRFRQVQYLINSGVPLDGPESPSCLVAALHIPNGRTRDRFFRFLLNSGANYNCVERRTGRNVLTCACTLDRLNEVKMLLSFAPGDIEMNTRDFCGYTALHHSVSTGNVHLVRLLLRHLMKYGLSTDVAAHNGLSPYQYAQKLGFQNVADVLRNEGFASVHRLSIIGQLPSIAEEHPQYVVDKDTLRTSIAGGWPLHPGGFVCQRQLELAGEAKPTPAVKHPPRTQGHVRFVGLRNPQPRYVNTLAKSLDSGLQTTLKRHSESNTYGRVSSNASRRIIQGKKERRNIDLPSMIGAISLEMSPSYRAPAGKVPPIMGDNAAHEADSHLRERLASNTFNANSNVLATSGSKQKTPRQQSVSHGHESTTPHPCDIVRAAVEKFKRKLE